MRGPIFDFINSGTTIKPEIVPGPDAPEGPPRRTLSDLRRVPVTTASALYCEHLELLEKKLDLHLDAVDHRVIAAVLVSLVYEWNAECDYREVRAIVADVHRELRGDRLATIPSNSARRERLIAALTRFLEHPATDWPDYVRRAWRLPATSRSFVLEWTERFIAMTTDPPANFLQLGADLGSTMLRNLDSGSLTFEIPGIEVFIVPAYLRAAKQANPGSLLAFQLVEMLQQAYGSQRFATSDAELILSRIFGEAFQVESVPNARGRRKDPRVTDPDFQRFATFQTYAALVPRFEAAARR